MNIVMIVPTGVGAEIGGHAGDATPAARLLGSVCDNIILHPNVVNACDINEMPNNAIYVDGHTLDRFLEGRIGLVPVKANKILVAIDPPIKAETVNALRACEVTLGIDIKIAVLDEPFILNGYINGSGLACGYTSGGDKLVNQVQKYDFDVLAILTPIKIEKAVVDHYVKYGGSNPWGKVEALACHPISEALKCVVAHAPIDNGSLDGHVNTICDPRMGAEFVSIASLFCVIKGLHKAPRWTENRLVGTWVSDIDLMVSPDMQFGPPHHFCEKRNVPMLFVRENKTMLPRAPDTCIKVENYIEAAGYVACLGAGINPKTVRRPLDLGNIDDNNTES